MIAPCSPSLQDVQQDFAAMLPELASRLAWRFRFRDAEAQADLVAEAIAVGWDTYRSARLRDRSPTPGNLAFFAGRSVAAGRRLAGTVRCDALSDGPARRTRAASLEQVPISGLNVYKTFGDRRWRWAVLDLVAAQLDWNAFVAACDARDRKIVRRLATGMPQNRIARQLGITPAAVCQRIGRLYRQWQTLSMGQDDRSRPSLGTGVPLHPPAGQRAAS